MSGVEDLFAPDPTDSTAQRLTRGTQLWGALKSLDNAAVAEDAIDALEPEGLRSMVLAQLYRFQQHRTDKGMDGSASADYGRWCSEGLELPPPADFPRR